jgi:adenylate cyclase
MFTDVQGYSAWAQRDESGALEGLEKQRRVMRPMFVKHGGREVKTIGDSFLVEFDSALAAVACATEIQAALRRSGRKDFPVRIGIHLGDVIHRDGDILGDTVNIASRIDALAPPGGICVTQPVYESVANKGTGLTFESLGAPRLKNINTPIQVYRAVSSSTRGSSSSSEGTADGGNRVAVLPFTNMSPDPNDEYFADGMTEELISTLSRVGGLKVIARTSVMQYKDVHKKANEVAAELRVGSLLEGSVRKAGNKLRVTVQLIDPHSNDTIWSESYDRNFKDVFSIQSDIAGNVAKVLTVQLGAQRVRLHQNETQNTSAYTHYLKGRYFWNQRELDGFKKALVEFESAIKLDPLFAPAYAGLADTHLLLGRNGHVSPRYAYPKAIRNARKAISLDPNLPEPHVTIAAIRQEYEWKWRESEKEFRYAISLNPGNPIAHSWYALYLGHIGQVDQAIEEANMAQELDPLSPRAHCAASEEYLFARRFDESVAAAERALEINSQFGGAYGYRAYAYVEKGMYDEAIADFQEAGTLLGARAWMGRLGHAYAISGRLSEANKILKELTLESRRIPPKSPFLPPPPGTAFDIGLVMIGLGKNEKAMGYLEQAADQRTAEIIHVRCEPIYDRLQGEPRFRRLVKRIGLGSSSSDTRIRRSRA